MHRYSGAAPSAGRTPWRHSRAPRRAVLSETPHPHGRRAAVTLRIRRDGTGGSAGSSGSSHPAVAAAILTCLSAIHRRMRPGRRGTFRRFRRFRRSGASRSPAFRSPALPAVPAVPALPAFRRFRRFRHFGGFGDPARRRFRYFSGSVRHSALTAVSVRRFALVEAPSGILPIPSGPPALSHCRLAAGPADTRRCGGCGAGGAAQGGPRGCAQPGGPGQSALMEAARVRLSESICPRSRSTLPSHWICAGLPF